MATTPLPMPVVLRIVAIVFGVLVALRFLWFAHGIFIVAFLGILLGLAVTRAVDYLERVRIRRALGSPLVVLVIVAVLVGIGAMIGPAIREQSREIGRDLPRALQAIEKRLGVSAVDALAGGAQQGQSKEPRGDGIGAQLAKELRGAMKFLFPVVSSIFGAIGGLLIILVIAIYFAAEPDIYRKGFLHLVPHSRRERAEEVLTALGDALRQWLIARLIAMVAVGLITGLGLMALNVKAAAALGVLAGLLEFIPFFGPIASAIPAIGIALVDSPQKALWVAGLYLVMQQLEGNVITPLLLERRLSIPPILTIISVAGLGLVFGVLGMLIAEPLLAATLLLAKILYVEDAIGDNIS